MYNDKTHQNWSDEFDKIQKVHKSRKIYSVPYYYISSIDNNKIEILEQKKIYYENSKNSTLEQKKKYYENSRNDRLEYLFYKYYRNNHNLSNEIISILYSIKENNKIKKFKNVNYYITLAELYNIEIT